MKEYRLNASGDCDWSGVEAVLHGLRAPAPDAKVAEWAAECAALTASAQGDEGGNRLILQALSRKCRDYPGDVVRVAFDTWPDTNTFFPKWNEFRQHIARIMGDRGQMIARLERAVNRQNVTGLSDQSNAGENAQLNRNLRIAQQKSKIVNGDTK